MNEVERIFRLFDGFSELIHLQDEVNRKQAQIRSVNALECGNCDHWMKTTCAPDEARSTMPEVQCRSTRRRTWLN